MLEISYLNSHFFKSVVNLYFLLALCITIIDIVMVKVVFTNKTKVVVNVIKKYFYFK